MSEPALKDYDAPVDRIRLHLQGSTGRVLIVEGPTDAEVLGDLLDGCGIFPVGSRGIVLTTAEDLLNSGVSAFLAVIDADFLPVPSGERWDPVLHPYEERDLESMLIRLGGLERLLRYKGSSSKIEEFGGTGALVAHLLRIVEPITRLRIENANGSLGLCFDAVKLEDKIDLRSVELVLESYCLALAAASGCSGGRVLAIVPEGPQPAGPPRGKDVIAATSVALRRVAGSLSKAACDPEILARDLLAASSLILRDSEWFAHLSRRLSAA